MLILLTSYRPQSCRRAERCIRSLNWVTSSLMGSYLCIVLYTLTLTSLNTWIGLKYIFLWKMGCLWRKIKVLHKGHVTDSWLCGLQWCTQVKTNLFLACWLCPQMSVSCVLCCLHNSTWQRLPTVPETGCDNWVLVTVCTGTVSPNGAQQDGRKGGRRRERRQMGWGSSRIQAGDTVLWHEPLLFFLPRLLKYVPGVFILPLETSLSFKTFNADRS